MMVSKLIKVWLSDGVQRIVIPGAKNELKELKVNTSTQQQRQLLDDSEVVLEIN
jgi:hypothetical protein